LIKNNSYDTVFAHSLRGGVLVWISRLILRKTVFISTVIHQLPSLSAPSQRRKRYFYSRFTDNLLIFSESARKDWNYYLQKNLIIRIIAGSKKIKTCRNGVFLPRLPEYTKDVILNGNFSGRLIFIGRLKAWKGLDTFLEIAQNHELKNFEILIVTPTDPIELIEKLDVGFQKRVTCIVGKSISEIDFKPNDIHLYPANYGPDSLYTEGVSINVLEMACLGVTSLITFGGSETWPELVNLGLVLEVNWSNPNSVVKIITSRASLAKNLEVELAKKIIDINNNITKIISNS
jgi:glycosyltransferase involved in cell wall biosynthesis